MNGCRIPPLIGLCTKKSAPIAGEPIFLHLRDPMINSLFGDYTDVPPILVIYDKKDKPKLGKLYEEHILMKVMLTLTITLTLHTRTQLSHGPPHTLTLTLTPKPITSGRRQETQDNESG